MVNIKNKVDSQVYNWLTYDSLYSNTASVFDTRMA